MTLTPWTHENAFLPGTIVRADAMNLKLDGIAQAIQAICNQINQKIPNLPATFTGETQIPEKTLPNSLLLINSAGAMDLYPKAQFDTDVANAASAAVQAATSATNAQNSASQAQVHEQNAEEHAEAAFNSATAAATFAESAEQAKDDTMSALNIRLGTTGNLGTAAQRPVMNSPIDAVTPEALMPRGAFGWGGTVPDFVGSIDQVNIPSAFYLVAPTNGGNKPPGSGNAFGFLQVINLGDRNRQIWYDTSNNLCFTRQYNPGLASWTNWDTFTFRGEFGLGGVNPYKQDWNVGNVTQFFTQSVPTYAMDGENSDGNWWHILKLMSPNVPMGAIALKTHRAGGFPMVPELWTAQLNASTGVPERFSRHYHTNNVIGVTVNPSFAPRGALIESGSNANGQYVRYADGTQICYTNRETSVPINNVFGNLFWTGSNLWTFPATFSAPPTVSVSEAGGVGACWGGLGTGGTNSANTTFAIFRVEAVGARPTASLKAIGRWY